MKLSTLHKRILSALVLGPLTLLVIFFGGLPFTALIAVGALLSLYEFYTMERQGKIFTRMMPFWIVYVAVCAVSFLQLRLGFANGLYLVLAVMLTVWACDIGAYVVGKALGGPKMTPILSPKKTWSGLIGGMVCSGLTLMGFDLWQNIFTGHPVMVFAAGCFLGAVGQAGDLLISAIKRRVGVKDTGQLIPGHGGLLDRIDSLLLVTPVFFVICMVWLP
ncbi:MAG: phosphatidate cytidylyltransferase [Micavibrio sp.]